MIEDDAVERQETVEPVMLALEIQRVDGTWFPLDLAACLSEAAKAHLRQHRAFRIVVYGHMLNEVVA